MSTLLLACVLGCSVGAGFSNPVKDNSIEVDDSFSSYVSNVTWGDFYEPPVTTTAYDFETPGDLTEFHDQEDVDVDEKGCHVRQKNELEAKCLEAFEGATSESTGHMIATVGNEKTFCCALEEYEKCSVRGHLSTNCDMKALKENLKAARIFMEALIGIRCSDHRVKCSKPSGVLLSTSLYVLLGLLLMILAKLLW